jgi:hypothetical protein
MLAVALQDVDEVGVGIDAVEPAGDDEASDDADLFGTQIGPAEQPRLSAHGNNTQRALEVVGVDRNIRIGDEHLKAEPASFGIDQRLDERMSGREALTFERAFHPVEEDFELGFAVREPIELFSLPGEAFVADFLVDGIERLDWVSACSTPAGSDSSAL